MHHLLALVFAPLILVGAAGQAGAKSSPGTTQMSSLRSTYGEASTPGVLGGRIGSPARSIPVASPDARWYSGASAFNQPIPRGTPYRPNDASLISALVNVAGAPLGPNLSASAVYFADADMRTVTVHNNHPVCNAKVFQVPIPPGAKSPSELNPSNLEPKMVVMERSTGIEWSMFKITAPSEPPLSSGGPRCPRNGDWNATIVTKFDPASGAGGWQGFGNEACCSGAASRIYYPAGLVRPRDVRSRAATWGHALSMSYGGILNAFVYPAKSYGGFCRDVKSCVPTGARFQLDPSFDCARTRLLVHRWERQACRTMQVYGMIVKDSECIWPCRGIGYDTVNSYSVRLPIGRYVDGGGNYRFPFDRAAGYREMPVEMLRHFHVIDWTKWTGRPALFATVKRSGSVSLRMPGGENAVHLPAGDYVITVRDASTAHAFRLIRGPRTVLRVSGKRYIGTLRWRIRLVRGIYRYSSGARSASRAMFAVV